MVYNRSRLEQTVQLIVADEPPAGVDYFTVMFDDIAVDSAGEVGVVADDLSAQDVCSPFAQSCGDAFYAEFRLDRFERYVDVADLAGIPRALKSDGVHRQTGMVIEKHGQDDCLAFGALAQLVQREVNLHRKTYPEQHSWCLENFLRQREIEITECLLSACAEKLNLMQPMDDYAVRRLDTLIEKDGVEETVFFAHLKDAIAEEQGVVFYCYKPHYVHALYGVTMIEDATFEIERGELFCVMGLSGSGKSTLVRHVNRLLELTAGHIFVGGVDVMGLTPSELRELCNHRVAMVFQNFGLMPHRTVRDNVAMPLEIRGTGKAKRWEEADRVLELVELTGWEDRYAQEFSGGMQQRVGLARAIASDPEILLMDEPFSALDPLIRKQLQDQFMEPSRELKKTTMFITHDLDEAIRISMRTLLDWIEVLLVDTPWPVVALIVIMLAYLGLLGFWEKAMTTVALLGAAAMISITLVIPLGIYCARRPRAFAIVRPILDFMQSMPSFVYLIPVVAFIGSGKPAGVVATMIFGSPPVIRFTVLGLQQVPEAVREAALAFGATPRYLHWRVDLPLAAPTIMAGVNQTIPLSLAMVVVASLTGAKGLGEDVLEALQYAAAGQGILAGLTLLELADKRQRRGLAHFQYRNTDRGQSGADMAGPGLVVEPDHRDRLGHGNPLSA